jgi:crotonobetainyl-CoA:carnitine CoA-transferase CaiB-like acyl-CoA transferase
MTPKAQGPLKGMRVLELSQIMAGPVCGLMLADMGADVIKIEKFPAGDDSRGYARPGDPGLAPSFLMLNRGKRSVAVDIRLPQGQEVIRRLVARCDVMTENFRRGKLDALGLGYDDLRRIQPELIYCSISGYGPHGPLSDQGGFDLVLQAFSGLISATGTPDGQIVKPANSVADINAGILAAVGILAAYIERLKTGQGCKVETSLLQASMQQMYWFAAAYFNDGTIAKPMGTAHPLIAPYQTFRCRTGAIALGGGNQANWERIAQILGHPEWLQEPRFKNGRSRVAHRAELEALITQALSSDDAPAWVQRFDLAGVPVGPVNDVGQALEHPQVRATSMVVDVDHADGGKTPSLGLPLHFNGASPHATSAAPYVGQHTVSVLRELDFEPGEIDALMTSGAVFQH